MFDEDAQIQNRVMDGICFNSSHLDLCAMLFPDVPSLTILKQRNYNMLSDHSNRVTLSTFFCFWSRNFFNCVFCYWFNMHIYWHDLWHGICHLCYIYDFVLDWCVRHEWWIFLTSWPSLCRSLSYFVYHLWVHGYEMTGFLFLRSEPCVAFWVVT